MQDLQSPRRRRLLTGLGAGIVATGIGSVAAQAQEAVTVTLDNVGTTAWEVTDVAGDDNLAETGTENPTLTLQEDVRYTIENDGWSSHPLAFLSSDGSALLSQSEDGSFEDDDDVGWVDESERVEFTLTSELADELTDYICTVHPSMTGTITVATAQDQSATVEFSDQSTDGTSVLVDSTSLPEGGFVTIHDSSLLDGETIESVVGVSEYLGPGTSEDIEVQLDGSIAEDDTLIAMAHRDTNDNERYDFVETGGEEDGPYTRNGNVVLDDAAVTVDAPAAVSFSDQESAGSSVTVDSARLDEGGFIVIHDSSLLDGEALESVVGASEYLDPGEHEAIQIEFDEELTGDDTLIAMAHRDTNDNQSYDFGETGGAEDGAYAFDGAAVTDSASVTVAGGGMDGDDDMGDGTGDEMNNETTDDEAEGSADDGGPGFGPIAGVAGLGGLATYAYRKLSLDSKSPAPTDDGLAEETDK